MVWPTFQEAANLPRVPVSWLYKRTRRNSVPHVKLGKCLRFDPEELAATPVARRSHDALGSRP